MTRPRKIGIGALTALFTLAGVGVVLARNGGQMFNPGPLNAHGKANTATPGAKSHAALSQNCSACHVPPWSGETMAGRCLNCHDNVKQQIAIGASLHGKMANAANCMSCHTEHRGAHAAITSFHAFNHNDTAYPLTGKHLGVSCTKCHKDETAGYKIASKSCVSCHAEPASHVGTFGNNCSQCHTTATWAGSTFSHRFPIDHKGAMKKSGCATCHDPGVPMAKYTCYNCHAHEKSRMERKHAKLNLASIDHCATCHTLAKKRQAMLFDGAPSGCEFAAGNRDAADEMFARWLRE